MNKPGTVAQNRTQTLRGCTPGPGGRSLHDRRIEHSVRAQAVAAGESGSFSYVASLVYDYTTLEHAEQTFTGGPLHGTVTVTESRGGPFAEGQHSVVTCFVYSRKSDAGLDLETPCTNTDASGEQWFLMALRKAGDIQAGGGGEGHQELMGGTGKYAA